MQLGGGMQQYQANRLASNSLLEGLLFGRRIGRQVQGSLDEIKIREGFKPEYFVKEWVERY